MSLAVANDPGLGIFLQQIQLPGKHLRPQPVQPVEIRFQKIEHRSFPAAQPLAFPAQDRLVPKRLESRDAVLIAVFHRAVDAISAGQCGCHEDGVPGQRPARANDWRRFSVFQTAPHTHFVQAV